MLKKLTAALVALGPIGVLVLAFLDSTGVPVSAGLDALLIVLAVNSPGTAWLPGLLAVIGSVSGNVVLFYIARRGGRAFLAKESNSKRAPRLRAWFDRYGLVTVFVPALIPFPMPMKLFVVCAGALGTPFSRFIAVVAIARILRYGGDVLLGAELGRDSLGFLEHHVWHFAIAGVLLFIALYLLVRLNDSTRQRLHSR